LGGWLDGTVVFPSLRTSFTHFLPESETKNGADEHDAGEEHDQSGVIVGRDSARPEQDIADDKIDPGPNHINSGRGKSASRWMREWSGKAVAGNAMKEVRDHVGEKGSCEKAGDIVVPVHRALHAQEQ
jgi:hypothetical protein